MSENREILLITDSAMKEELVCWKCGKKLRAVILPMSRREECSFCQADQHVCRMCKFYDAAAAGQCTEERAEDIFDKERANFCGYFEPQANAYRPEQTVDNDEVQAQLEALFGGDKSAQSKTSSTKNPPMYDDAVAELQKLFEEFDKKKTDR